MRSLILLGLMLASSMTFAEEISGTIQIPNDQMPLFSCNAKIANYSTGKKYVEANVSRNQGFSGKVRVDLKISGEDMSYPQVVTGQADESSTQKLINNILRVFGPSNLTAMTGLVSSQVTSVVNSLIYQFGNTQGSETWGYFEVFVNEQGSPLGASLTLHEGQAVSTGACVPVNGFHYEKPVGFGL
jgi:hypothetical protein